MNENISETKTVSETDAEYSCEKENHICCECNNDCKKEITEAFDNQEENNICDSACKNPKKGWKKELKEWVVAIVFAVIAALIIRTFIFEPVRVSGGSMKETLQNNEIMIVTKYDYLFGKPNRFDIVICHYPGRKEAFVKRIVGLPGDTVSMNNGILSVNGVEYEENYITHRPGYTLDEISLADDEYFVLGDNRSNSNDSHIIGPIHRNQILGHSRLVIFPFSNIRILDIKPEK